ncbi:MAG: Holliday junction branch migration DNA helicase RuvB [Chloroflexota bacterium]|nr:Holliday junction branch migration DNA helicase RuvB [Chloroflexota bacterium]MDQ5865868.1 Holliday junction branch migration DNA helicase RuvB [Chloroflexota bacterium]
MVERLISAKTRENEEEIEQTLRPRRIAEYIGQEKLKDHVQIMLEAAQARSEVLDHLLFYGPPGLGKTTISQVIANEMGVPIKTTSGPAIERPGDLASVLTNLKANEILFIDEIHRLNRVVEEVLYPAMEDFALDVMIGKGPSARSLRLALPPFTIIGATTRLAMLSSPLRDRFGVTFRLEYYSREAMEMIITRSARILGVAIEDDGAKEIASRSRGTPRIANRLLRRVRDYAQVRADGVITAPVAQEALRRLEIDNLGCDETDRRILHAIIDKFDGGPVGLDTIAAAISEESDTIMDVYEPYLLQLGFLARTPRGRIATRKGYEHMGVPYPLRMGMEEIDVEQGKLF